MDSPLLTESHSAKRDCNVMWIKRCMPSTGKLTGLSEEVSQGLLRCWGKLSARSPYMCSRFYFGYEALQRWWKLTTDPQFIANSPQRQNRGTVLRALTVITTIWCITATHQQAVGFSIFILPVTQVSYTAFVEYGGLIQWPSLFNDVVIMMIMLLQWVSNVMVDQSADPAFELVDIDCVYLLWLAIMNCLGVHVLVVLIYVTVVVGCVGLPGDSSTSVDVALVSLCFVVGHSSNQFHLAMAFQQELQAAESKQKAMQDQISCIQAHQKTQMVEQAYSSALTHLKTPLLLARSGIEALSPDRLPSREDWEMFKMRVNQLWNILKQTESHFCEPARDQLAKQIRRHKRTVVPRHAVSLPPISESSDAEEEDRAVTCPDIVLDGADLGSSNSRRHSEIQAVVRPQFPEPVEVEDVLCLHGVRLLPVVAHLRELVRHFPTNNASQAHEILLDSAQRLVQQWPNVPCEVCSSWLCNLCSMLNDDEDEECFVCQCERGMDHSDLHGACGQPPRDSL